MNPRIFFCLPMGGRQAGEVASDLAVKECYTWLKENFGRAKREEDVSKILIESLLKAHDAVKAKSMTDVNLMGMGTTLTEMIIKKDEAYICHIGDCRVYLLRNEIKQAKLKPADILLLCSDGLTDMLSDKEIESIIQKYRGNLAMIADNLIQEANNEGGIDNISVILIEYE